MRGLAAALVASILLVVATNAFMLAPTLGKQHNSRGASVASADAQTAAAPRARATTTTTTSSRCSATQLLMSSFSLDASIEDGEVDPEIRKKIEGPLKVLGPIVDLIDTRGNILTFKYNGQIRNKIGIEAYARQMIKEAYPALEDVHFVTNRVRDWRDD